MKKTLLIIAITMVSCLVVNAQRKSIHDLLNQHAYTGQYPVRHLPKATPELMTRAADASGQPFVFPHRVWFPGEWEEVKAIVVAPEYYYWIPGHEKDERWTVSPVVEGYGEQYYQATRESKIDTLGIGPYTPELQIDSARHKVFFYLMDGIQKGGAEAWVRIAQASDKEKVIETLESMGLRHDNLRFLISSGNAFWFRDCGPICFYYGDNDEVAMLDFLYDIYRPMDDLLPSILHRQMDIPNYISSVVWEGGNCLVDGVGGLVTSTATYLHNTDTLGPIVWDGRDTTTISRIIKPSLSEEETKEALRSMLGQRDIHVLKHLEFDGGTGHVDLYADATDENGYLFAEMPKIYEDWKDYKTVTENVAYMYQQKSFWGRDYYDMGRLPFPAKDDGSAFENEREYGSLKAVEEGEYDKNYTRTYANHAIVNNYILQPCFSPVGADGMPTAEWDRKNIEQIKQCYPGYTFYCVDMRTFDGYGGSIHCVTKQIPADNPIRILHKTIHGNVNPGELTTIPFSAIITNKSGIKEASLVYRVGNGEWTTKALTANGNRFSCTIPLSDLLGTHTLAEGVAVDYYFKVTSNNDKTVTKPLNAASGALFNFTLTSNATYDEQMFDFSTEPVDKKLITFELKSLYLTEDTSSGSETGITEIGRDVRTAKAAWYTINGIQLGQRPTTKGIYIYNGKKVIIK